MLVPKKWPENGVRRKFSEEINMPRTWIAREMYQQLRKKRSWNGCWCEISRPIDCKKWHFVAPFFIQRMALVNGALISRPIVRKRSFVVLLFVFNSQNEVYLWNKAIKKKKADLSIMRKESFGWIMLIILLFEVLAVIFLQYRCLIQLCIKVVGKLAVTNK